MENSVEEIKDMIARLLAPQKSLDAMLFSKDELLHPEVSTQLMENARAVINNTISEIEGLAVKDVCLVGMPIGYSYSSESDIDVKILVENENCPFLTKDKTLEDFLYLIKQGKCGFLKFKLGQRSVNITMVTSIDDLIGIYSVMNNQWIKNPSKRLTDDLTVDMVWQVYNDHYWKIQAFFHHISTNDRLKQKENIEKLEANWKNLFGIDLSDAKDYISFQILLSQGLKETVTKTITDSWKKYFSLR